MEDVTQVRFHPSGALFSGSMDGLICVFDISQNNEDDAVQNGTQFASYSSLSSQAAFSNSRVFSLWLLVKSSMPSKVSTEWVSLARI
jgi:hypothetical protein